MILRSLDPPRSIIAAHEKPALLATFFHFRGRVEAGSTLGTQHIPPKNWASNSGSDSTFNPNRASDGTSRSSFPSFTRQYRRRQQPSSGEGIYRRSETFSASRNCPVILEIIVCATTPSGVKPARYCKRRLQSLLIAASRSHSFRSLP